MGHDNNARTGLTRHTTQQLLSELLNMVSRKCSKIILFEEVINTHAQKFRHQTNMVAVIEPTQKVDTVAEKILCQESPDVKDWNLEN